MICERKTPSKNKLFSINRQIYEKMNSKKKINIPPNFKANEISTICITPTKFQKYLSIYSKYKSYSKANTKMKTITNSKSTAFKPSSSVTRFNHLNSNTNKKFPSLISNFNNSNNILHQNTPKRKSRNIHYKIKKNSTMDKKINFDKFYPSIQSLNNNNNINQSQSLMGNTMRSLSISYKKFFLNKKKINIASINKNKNINKSEKYKNSNEQNKKMHKIKKFKIAINDDEISRNKIEKNEDLHKKIIKSILNLKYIQNKVQNEFQKKNEMIMKKISVKNYEEDSIKEFSFNKDYTNNNYYNDECINNCENNNDDIMEILNKKERCNLIQSKIMKLEKNKGIYEENYECDTPQFTTLDAQ